MAHEHFIEACANAPAEAGHVKKAGKALPFLFTRNLPDRQSNKYSISIDSPSYKFLEEYDFVMHRFFNNIIDMAYYPPCTPSRLRHDGILAGL